MSLPAALMTDKLQKGLLTNLDAPETFYPHTNNTLSNHPEADGG